MLRNAIFLPSMSYSFGLAFCRPHFKEGKFFPLRCSLTNLRFDSSTHLSDFRFDFDNVSLFVGFRIIPHVQTKNSLYRKKDVKLLDECMV